MQARYGQLGGEPSKLEASLNELWGECGAVDVVQALSSGSRLLSSMELMINCLVGSLFEILDLSLNLDFPLAFVADERMFFS